MVAMACGVFASYGHSSSYVHIDHLSHGLGSYDGGYDHYDDHDYHVSISQSFVFPKKKPTKNSEFDFSHQMRVNRKLKILIDSKMEFKIELHQSLVLFLIFPTLNTQLQFIFNSTVFAPFKNDIYFIS